MSKRQQLNKREIQVLKLVLKELTNKEIGLKIGLSKRTIEGIRLRLMTKTRAKNAIGLLKWAINNNLVKVNNQRKPKIKI